MGGAGSVTMTCCTVPVTGRSSPDHLSDARRPRTGGIHHAAGDDRPLRCLRRAKPRRRARSPAPRRRAADGRRHAAPASAPPSCRAAGRHSPRPARNRRRSCARTAPVRARAVRSRRARGFRCPSAAPSPTCGAATPTPAASSASIRPPSVRMPRSSPTSCGDLLPQRDGARRERQRVRRLAAILRRLVVEVVGQKLHVQAAGIGGAGGHAGLVALREQHIGAVLRQEIARCTARRGRRRSPARRSAASPAAAAAARAGAPARSAASSSGASNSGASNISGAAGTGRSGARGAANDQVVGCVGAEPRDRGRAEAALAAAHAGARRLLQCRQGGQAVRQFLAQPAGGDLLAAADDRFVGERVRVQPRRPEQRPQRILECQRPSPAPHASPVHPARRSQGRAPPPGPPAGRAPSPRVSRPAMLRRRRRTRRPPTVRPSSSVSVARWPRPTSTKRCFTPSARARPVSGWKPRFSATTSTS